jgi:hypothetical protein
VANLALADVDVEFLEQLCHGTAGASIAGVRHARGLTQLLLEHYFEPYSRAVRNARWLRSARRHTMEIVENNSDGYDVEKRRAKKKAEEAGRQKRKQSVLFELEAQQASSSRSDAAEAHDAVAVSQTQEALLFMHDQDELRESLLASKDYGWVRPFCRCRCSSIGFRQRRARAQQTHAHSNEQCIFFT